MSEAAVRGEKWGRANGRPIYDTMTTSEIAALPVAEVAHKDSLLFLWATGPKLADAFEVMAAWGFSYRTTVFTWVKLTRQGLRNLRKWQAQAVDPEEILAHLFHAGNGYWSMANAEFVLLGRRPNGKPKRVRKDVRSLVVTPLGAHSAKPPEVRDRIVRLCGDLPRLELFARDRAPGWDAIGEEITGNDISFDLAHLASLKFSNE